MLETKDLQMIAKIVTDAIAPLFAKIDALEARFDVLEAKVDALEKRFDALESRFDALEKRFDALEAKVDALEKRIDALEARFDALEAKVDAHVARFDALEARFDALEAKVDAHVVRFDALESRFDALETKVDDNHHTLTLQIDSLEGRMMLLNDKFNNISLSFEYEVKKVIDVIAGAHEQTVRNQHRILEIVSNIEMFYVRVIHAEMEIRDIKAKCPVFAAQSPCSP